MQLHLCLPNLLCYFLIFQLFLSIPQPQLHLFLMFSQVLLMLLNDLITFLLLLFLSPAQLVTYLSQLPCLRLRPCLPHLQPPNLLLIPLLHLVNHLAMLSFHVGSYHFIVGFASVLEEDHVDAPDTRLIVVIVYAFFKVAGDA